MFKFKKKQKTITPAERIALANERTGTALFVFEQAAIEMEAAADDFAEVANDCEAKALSLIEQAEALDYQALAADQRAMQSLEQASKIRSLLSVTTN